MATNQSHRFLMPAEAAKQLGISPAELTRLRASGNGPDWVLISRTVRYSLADLNHWQTHHSTSCP